MDKTQLEFVVSSALGRSGRTSGKPPSEKDIENAIVAAIVEYDRQKSKENAK